MSLTSLSPIDGRYQEDTKELIPYFSEFALIRYRVFIEVEYLLSLSQIIKNLKLDEVTTKNLKNIYFNFSLEDAKEIKKIEITTNHDIKAIEYFLKERLQKLNLKSHLSFIHFGLTSEDVNNLVYHLMWLQAVEKTYLPNILGLHTTLKKLATKYSDIPLLSLTHGQPATPTTIGKEINVFAVRLARQIEQIKQHKLTGKLNGATGTFSAHMIAYPEIDWLEFSQKFINKLGLLPNQITTQVESNDSLTESYHNIIRINSILTDLTRDFWFYISRGIFIQKKKESEVGSSTMPHKINPIQFENAEGNLGLANSLLNHLASVLPISRMQRDLSNSTVIRNQGVPLTHSLLAIKQIILGLERLSINQNKINEELENHWEVLTEAIQTICRKYGDDEAYEKIKSLSRGEKINKNTIQMIIMESQIPEEDKQKLLELTPQNYLGLAKKLSTLE